ncbi:MAG TPA: hypothetical protein VFO79_11435, partial [Xanthomonadales bacterium]|nr:hypothetical protein [Xanthomonadales bacterium]
MRMIARRSDVGADFAGGAGLSGTGLDVQHATSSNKAEARRSIFGCVTMPCMGERVESQGFYEMLWDCGYCDTKGLLGKSQRHCANCGAKQNPDKRYVPTEEQKQRIEGHKYEGSDRTCPSCHSPMG